VGHQAREVNVIPDLIGNLPKNRPYEKRAAFIIFGGIQYRIGSLAQLYFQPELSYYFTRTDLVTYRTEHPLGVSLHVGLRFDL